VTPSPDFPPLTRQHVLQLGTASDDAALDAWVSAINADCADTVRAYVPPGTVTLRGQPWLPIASPCNNARRHVEIFGAGADSSIVQVASLTPDGGGGIGLFISDPGVHMHDLGFRSLADSTVMPPDGGNGNSDEAIKFAIGPNGTGGFGEADHMRFVNFRTAAIDVFGAPGMALHDNVVRCPPMLPPNYPTTMGLWIRALYTPPPPGASNGTISNNQVFNCGDSGINVDNASYTSITGNIVTCDVGGCPQGVLLSPIRHVLGIILFADHLGCSDAAVSHNVITGNRVAARNRIGVGIIIEGVGLGQYNLVANNVVDSTVEYGIATSNVGCPGQPNTAFAHNTIVQNSVVNVAGYGIWNGGDSALIAFNRVCPVDFRRNIVDISSTAVLKQNDGGATGSCLAGSGFRSATAAPPLPSTP